MLESCGTRGRAPYDAVLTHGFTMDAKGMKMSKSLGNTVNPLDLMRDYGADILRLWALSVDFTEDHRIGKEILAGVADQYRKLRNTFRYLLGALDDDEHVRRTRTTNFAGVQFLQTEFEKLGIEFVPTAGNFILLRVGDGARVFSELQKLGVITRPMAGYQLPEWLRVSVGTAAENARFLAGLRRVLGK